MDLLFYIDTENQHKSTEVFFFIIHTVESSREN